RAKRFQHFWNLRKARGARLHAAVRRVSTLMLIPTACYEFTRNMAVLNILKYPDSVLSQPAVPVEKVTEETVRIFEDLLDTMYAAPGIGLAAPQVGISQRVIVLDVDHENPRKQVYKLVNPVVVQAEGEVIWEEGCLSVVDFTAEVRRAAQVVVEAFDENEREIKIEAEGLLAVALQ